LFLAHWRFAAPGFGMAMFLPFAGPVLRPFGIFVAGIVFIRLFYCWKFLFHGSLYDLLGVTTNGCGAGKRISRVTLVIDREPALFLKRKIALWQVRALFWSELRHGYLISG
jgi:hypothetical protein